MAKVKFVTIPPGLESFFNKAVQPNDRFLYSTMRMTNPFVSRKLRKALTQKSQLPLCSEIWKSFTQEVRDLWTVCGRATGLTGFRFFVQDKVLRLKNFLEGESIPSLLYQSTVGRIHIASPASSIAISQLHPLTYYVLRKKTGKATMFEMVEIVEQFSLPLNLSINYKSNLTAVTGSPSARFYAIVYSSYQGRTIESICAVNFDLISGWKTATVGIGEVQGLVRGYALFMDFDNVRGDLFFDDVKAIHNGTNWVRDTNCNNIKQTFTKQFSQVPAHWIALDLPTGSYYNSEYGNLS